MTKMLLAHGSSDSIHGKQVLSLAAKVSTLLDKEVRAAFLSDDKLPKDAHVLPLFLGAGKHVTEDIPKLAAASQSTLLPSLGEHSEAIVELAYDALTHETKRINVLFALYRFGGFEQLSAALHASNKRCSQVAMASMHSEPSVTSVLNLWHDDDIETVTLQPMLLFPGHSLARVRTMINESAIPDVTVAAVLSELDGFAELVADCFRSDK